MKGALTGLTIAVLAEDMYEDLELWYPTLRLRAAGALVRIVGTTHPATYIGRKGYPVATDCAASDIRVGETDAVVVPGGYAPDLMRRSPPMVNLLRAANDNGKLIAAICHAGWLLAEADIVRGKRLTCFSSIKVDMVNAGGIYEDTAVVQDGNLVTSRTPNDLPMFGEVLVERLRRVAAESSTWASSPNMDALREG